jgi:BirA family transcriptional regulator, biotin operon repressor / biotin---[acetyl-CoA-carboxylase] ligase
MNINILYFESIDSTNTEAIKQARAGAAEGLCIMARQQTAGRGRHGRTWVSEPDSGLYFSIVLRPKIETRFLPLITLMTGVAVSDTLLEFGLKPDIKWVNDLLVNEKKIGGILAEAVETPTGLAVIVGIGVNLTSRNFPDDIAATATSIQTESGHSPSAGAFAQSLTKYFTYFYEILKSDRYREIIEHWRRRSSYFSGKAVRVLLGNSTIEGTTDGLEENGALRLKTADGSRRLIEAGEVQQLRQLNFH